MRQRLFTVEEANALIPRLESIMQQLQANGMRLRETIRRLADQSGELPEQINAEQLLAQQPETAELMAEVERLVGEIEDYGGDFKGLDLGLVDFPAEREGEIVLLCWQYGEKEITHYHTMDGGFTGRLPIDHEIGRPRYLQ